MSVPRVEQFMSRIPYTIHPEASLMEAHKLMRKYQIHHLPVTAENKVVGLVSSRDLHLIESLPDVDPEQVPVEDAMSGDPYCVSTSQSLLDVAAYMANHRIGSAIILHKGELAGVFTTHDALLALVHFWKDDRDR